MAGERNQDRERARARAAERLVVPASWARILDLARERWPGLDTRGVTSWVELGERLAEDDVLPEAQIEADLRKFRDSLPPLLQTPLTLRDFWLPERRARFYPLGSWRGQWRSRSIWAQLIDWLRGKRYAWGLPGDVGTDDDWSEEDKGKKQGKA